MATPFSEDGEAKPDPAILVEEAGSDLDVQGDTLEDAIDLDDLPDFITLTHSGMRVRENRVAHTIQKTYAKGLDKIANNVPNPTSKLNIQLRDAAGSARTVDKNDFVRNHKNVWATYVRSALSAAKADKERKEEILEEFNKNGRPEETMEFEQSLVKYARGRFKVIDRNKELTDDLVSDLKRHAP